MSGDFPSPPSQYGVETPIKFKSTTTAASIVFTAASNGARISVVRVAEVAGATPTVTLDVVDSDGITAYSLRSKAMTAGEVYKDYDIQLRNSEKLRVASSHSTAVHVTGIYVVPQR